MTSSPEIQRYFVAEAGECLDALDPLVAGVIGPDEGGTVVAAARALRGSATIAREPQLADVAFAMEQVGSGIRESQLGWTPMLGDALRHAVGEVRALLGTVGHWGDAERARVAAAEASVRRFVPTVARATPPMPASTTQPVFVALQASAIAADLEALMQTADRQQILDEVLSRVRVMQGVAGLHEYPPLADICDRIERVARATLPDAPLSEGETELFSAATALLRRTSSELRARMPTDPNSSEIRRFTAAASGFEPPAPSADRVVHVDELFYQDAGPHVVARSSTPPVTPERRFAEEVVSRAEHVRRLIADARSAGDGLPRQRIRRDLDATLQALETTAQSFGAAQLAALCNDASRRSDLLSPLELDALDAVAVLLLSPVQSLDELERRVAVLTRRHHTPPAGSRAGTPPSGARTTVTPKGRALHDFLATGLDGLRGLSEHTYADLDEPEDEDVVPVESLFYRGRAALLRAIQVRDTMRTRATPDADSLRELYDLLDLARTE